MGKFAVTTTHHQHPISEGDTILRKNWAKFWVLGIPIKEASFFSVTIIPKTGFSVLLTGVNLILKVLNLLFLILHIQIISTITKAYYK
jgi:hypothetical protein